MNIISIVVGYLTKPDDLQVDEFGHYWTTAYPEVWSKKDICEGALWLQEIKQNKFGVWERQDSFRKTYIDCKTELKKV